MRHIVYRLSTYYGKSFKTFVGFIFWIFTLSLLLVVFYSIMLRDFGVFFAIAVIGALLLFMLIPCLIWSVINAFILLAMDYTTKFKDPFLIDDDDPFAVPKVGKIECLISFIIMIVLTSVITHGQPPFFLK